MASDGYAVLVGGPEDGRHVFVGHCRPGRPRHIDFEAEDGSSIARYRRCTRWQFDARRSGGCGHIGQVTYRFVGRVEQGATA